MLRQAGRPDKIKLHSILRYWPCSVIPWLTITYLSMSYLVGERCFDWICSKHCIIFINQIVLPTNLTKVFLRASEGGREWLVTYLLLTSDWSKVQLVNCIFCWPVKYWFVFIHKSHDANGQCTQNCHTKSCTVLDFTIYLILFFIYLYFISKCNHQTRRKCLHLEKRSDSSFFI